MSSPRLSVDANYRLSVGDALLVIVYGEPTFSGSFSIGPGGSIAMPVLGQLSLRGMTLSEAKALITKKVSALVRHPDVTVSLNELASVRRVYVTGEVLHAGLLSLPFGATLTDAVTGAGPTAFADLRRVRLTHPATEPVTVDCSGLRGEGPLGAEHRLEYGDAIYVPRVSEEITVLGEVNSPGTIPVPVGQKVTVITALRVAQGFAPTADRSVAVLLREGSDPITVDLEKLLRQGDLAEDRELLPGDVLVVHRAGSLAVVGQVRQPFAVNVAVPVPILQALAQAGGATTAGDLTNAQIIRGGRAIPVDLQAFLDRGEAPVEYALRPGDVLVVPRGATQAVMVDGALQRVGSFDLRALPERDLWHVILMAGKTPYADLSRVKVYRRGETLVRDLKAAEERGALDQNLELESGDIVWVPQRDAETVLVTGEVMRSGVMQILEDRQRDLLSIVTVAGPTALADLRRVRLQRGTETIVCDLEAARSGRPDQSAQVKDGDIIVVPGVEATATIAGAVQRQGPIRLVDRQPHDLAALLSMAVPLPTADLTRVTLNRGGQKTTLDIRRFQQDGDTSQNITLQDGDVVWVPNVEASILLTGALQRSGTLRLYEGFDRSLGRLVMNAMPLLNADLERVRVHRGDQTIVRNLKAWLDQNDRSQDLDLQAGDTVVVPSKQIRAVLVTGAVRMPGLLQVDDLRSDLARLVTLVGPLPNADLTKVQVHRGEMVTVRDVKAYLDTGAPGNTLALEDGDVVVVPRGEHTISVVGAVGRPGTYQLMEEKERDLFRLVWLAMPTPNANLSAVTVHRAGDRFVKNLKAMAEEGDRTQTMTLQDGDIVTVAPYDETVLVTGAASRTGIVGLGPEPRQRDLATLVQSAQPAPYADLRKVFVARDGQQIPRNVYAYLYEGDASQTLELQDGDVVVIPVDRQTALVLGAVARAGPVRVSDPDDRDLLRLLLLAQPLPTADLQRVTLRKETGDEVYDFSGMRKEGAPTPKVSVEVGDTVFVPGLDAVTVLFSGALMRQGAIELALPEQRDLATALMAAGPTGAADLSSVIIHRAGQVIVRNVKAYLERNDQSQKETLQEGDRVLVPQLGPGAGVLVTGQVVNQGILPETIGQSSDLLRVVLLAQPLAATADWSKITVFRKGEQFVRDLKRLREQGDYSQNMTLDPGDIVYVPAAHDTIVFMGQVQRPGALNVHGVEERDLAHLLPTAGPLPDADLERIAVYRPGDVIIANYRALTRGDLSQNIALEPGDLIYVPPDTRNTVMVLGALQRTGMVSVREEADRDLLRIITASQPTALADLAHVTVLRGDQEPIYRDFKALHEGDMSQNMALEPGDVIVVPRLGNVYVFGAVARQGAIAVEPDSTVLDAITAAGGTIRAQQRVFVIRRRPDGKAERIEINLARLPTGTPPEPVKVKAGDILYVPPARAKRGLNWTTLRDIVWTLSGALNLWDDIRDRF